MGIVANADTSARAGWAVSGLSASLVGFWLVVGGAGEIGRYGLRRFLETDYSNIVFALMFPVVGALILSRFPGVAWGGCTASAAWHPRSRWFPTPTPSAA